MGKRKGIFCDLTDAGWSTNKAAAIVQKECPKLGEVVCAICDRDVCTNHSLDDTPALTITITLMRRLSFSEKSSPVLPNTPPMGRMVNAQHKVVVCRDCGEHVQAAALPTLEDFGQAYVDSLRAAIAAKELATDRPTTS